MRKMICIRLIFLLTLLSCGQDGAQTLLGNGDTERPPGGMEVSSSAQLLMSEEEFLAFERSKIENKELDQLLTKYSTRVEEMILVNNENLDLVSVHKMAANLDDDFFKLAKKDELRLIESVDELLSASEFEVYAKGLFIYLKKI